MSNEILERIKAQKFFYRDNYRRACTGLWFALLIIILLSLTIFYLYLERPIPDYYATSSNGKLVQLSSYDTPNYSHTPLIQ